MSFGMKWGAIEIALPDARLTNAQIARENPSWDMDRLRRVTGVEERRLAGENELASDLGFRAAERLIEKEALDPKTIDALLFCTLTPDHFAGPCNAAGLHARLGLRETALCFDYSLGCSGFVYGVTVATGLIRGLGLERVLLVTSDTLTKLVAPHDASTRMVLGDAAAATLFERTEAPCSLVDYLLGTEGKLADRVAIPAGGMKIPKTAATCLTQIDVFGNERSLENIHMDGGAVLHFARTQIPKQVKAVLERNRLALSDVPLVLFHQASAAIVDVVCRKLAMPSSQTMSNLAWVGNTSSASLPLLIRDARAEGRIRPGDLALLVGFGIGFSWGVCLVRW